MTFFNQPSSTASRPRRLNALPPTLSKDATAGVKYWKVGFAAQPSKRAVGLFHRDSFAKTASNPVTLNLMTH
ncbi:hypothetical protein [Polaromonas sp. Pch-P]|uniref:hypothetical protein n=1 Tax=Polaromonas sp. Pch-P TaxID=2082385 RepID=UPI001E4EE9F7|nr:hypothetical protein [Polaromonas sp. Pch-P]